VAGWRIESRAYSKRNLCHCGGAVGQESGYAYPHKITHPFCIHHPCGIYNQARRQGIEHNDIPIEYHPKKLNV